MKTKLIAIVLWTTIAATGRSFSEVKRPGHNPESLRLATTSEATTASEALTNVVETPSATPRGPEELLQAYQAGMTFIAQQFSAKVAAIAGAVQRGELSREEAENISAEQYQMAQMQFNLLSALREILQQDLARAATAPQSAPEPAPGNEIVMVSLPFSSFQLNPSVIAYLDLSSAQVRSIQDVMSDEHRNLEPLMAQLRTTREQLLNAAYQDDPKNKKEIKSLASVQARNLTRLIVANSRMRAKIYQLLSPQQQKKLDEFQKSAKLEAQY